ncbi:hypothetical protein EPN29_06735 [bacterium]|nr:MAG: hypothetical protein EPN29_06735 [bacterium]
MKLHRAVTLVVMMLLAVGAFVLLTSSAIGRLDAHSLIALGVVIAGAAAGGIAFSWKRYYRRTSDQGR